MKFFKTFIKLSGALLSAVLIYVFANFIGAIVPANDVHSIAETEKRTEQIVIAMGPIHSDIGIPFTEEVKKRFSFLKDNGVLFAHKGIKYLLFGWGSRAFYLTAKEFSDIRPMPVLKAVMGDRSVLHFSPVGDLSKSDKNIGLKLTRTEYVLLLENLQREFQYEDAKVRVVPDIDYGYGDRFFEHGDKFHLFKTCNIWTAAMLNKIGVKTGYWSTISNLFAFGLKRHSANRLVNTTG